jgi:hypothetical protein
MTTKSVQIMERDLISERTLDGLAAAAAHGRKGGRPTTVDADTLAIARARRVRGESITAIAKHLGIGRSTLYRALEDNEPPVPAGQARTPQGRLCAAARTGGTARGWALHSVRTMRGKVAVRNDLRAGLLTHDGTELCPLGQGVDLSECPTRDAVNNQ